MTRLADKIEKTIADKKANKIKAMQEVISHNELESAKAVNWLCNRAISALETEARNDGMSIAFIGLAKPMFRPYASKHTITLANRKLFAEGLSISYRSSDITYKNPISWDFENNRDTNYFSRISVGKATIFTFNECICINCNESISDPSKVKALFFNKYMCSDCELSSTLVGDSLITFDVDTRKPVCPRCRDLVLLTENASICDCDTSSTIKNAFIRHKKSFALGSEGAIRNYVDSLQTEYINKRNK